VASGMHKAGTVVAAMVADNSGDRAPRIGVRGDERTELGPLVVRVEFVVDFLPNKLYEVMSVPMGNNVPTYTYLRARLQG